MTGITAEEAYRETRHTLVELIGNDILYFMPAFLEDASPFLKGLIASSDESNYHPKQEKESEDEYKKVSSKILQDGLDAFYTGLMKRAESVADYKIAAAIGLQRGLDGFLTELMERAEAPKPALIGKCEWWEFVLHCAVAFERQEWVRQWEPSPQTKTELGVTLLSYAIGLRSKAKGDYMKVIAVLLNGTGGWNKNGELNQSTVLEAAISCDDDEVIGVLLKAAESPVNDIGRSTLTPYVFAVSKGSTKAMTLLSRSEKVTIDSMLMCGRRCVYDEISNKVKVASVSNKAGEDTNGEPVALVFRCLLDNLNHKFRKLYPDRDPTELPTMLSDICGKGGFLHRIAEKDHVSLLQIYQTFDRDFSSLKLSDNYLHTAAKFGSLHILKYTQAPNYRAQIITPTGKKTMLELICSPMCQTRNSWEMAIAVLKTIDWMEMVSQGPTSPFHSLARLRYLTPELLQVLKEQVPDSLPAVNLAVQNPEKAETDEVKNHRMRYEASQKALSTTDSYGSTPLNHFITGITENGTSADPVAGWAEMFTPKRNATFTGATSTSASGTDATGPRTDIESLTLVIRMQDLDRKNDLLKGEELIELTRKVADCQREWLTERVLPSKLCPVGTLVEVWKDNKEKGGGKELDEETRRIHKKTLFALLEVEEEWLKESSKYNSGEETAANCGCFRRSHRGKEVRIELEEQHRAGSASPMMKKNGQTENAPSSSEVIDSGCGFSCAKPLRIKKGDLDNYSWKAAAFDVLVAHTNVEKKTATITENTPEGRSSLLLSPLNRAIEYELTDFMDTCLEWLRPDPDEHPNTYDVTNFLLATMPENELEQGPNRQASVMEYAVACEQWDLLNKPPFDALLRSHWRPYRLLYNLVLFVHILNMGLVTYWTGERYGENQSKESEWWLRTAGTVWPVTVLVLGVFQFILVVLQKNNPCSYFMHRLTVHPEGTIENCLYKLVGVIYSITWIVWLVNHQIQMLSVSLVLGWIAGLQYFDGMRKIHHYNVAFRRMLVRDIMRFSAIVIGLIVGFAYAIFALTRGSCAIAKDTKTPGTMLLLIFRWTLGTADFFDIPRNISEAESCGDDEVGTETYGSWSSSHLYTLRGFYIGFMILLNLAFLNMLIAILSNSFSAAEENKGKAWLSTSICTATQTEQLMAMIPYGRAAYFNVVRKFMPGLRTIRLGVSVRYLFDANSPSLIRSKGEGCRGASFSCDQCKRKMRQLKKKLWPKVVN